MKFALLLVATLTLVGCSHDSPQRSPAAPSPTPVPTAEPASSAFLWAMVVDESGACIGGATIQVVGGQSAGVSVPQTTPCDAWAYDGGVVFKDLTPGVAMTLRATAPGWAPLEKTVVPSSGATGAILFTPSRTH
jgi:hypothetical protein